MNGIDWMGWALWMSAFPIAGAILVTYRAVYRLATGWRLRWQPPAQLQPANWRKP